MNDRASWSKVWMGVAVAVSKRSPCTNRQVGSVIVDTRNRIISVGYNGWASPHFSGGNTCEGKCPRSNGVRSSTYANCIAIHAEANALLFCDKRRIEGGTIYITNPPCFDCSKLIANSGLQHVVYMKSNQDLHYNELPGIELLCECGFQISVVEYEGA